MAMNQKINECGWFYHAPQKRKEVIEPIEIPITSQIPGLSDLPPEFDDKPRELYFKDTDTKYIRLAKQGGRKDLLTFKDMKPRPEEPKGYPRVDWYYLEDNAVEDAQEKKETDWQFLLPEYMVHEAQVRPTDHEAESEASLKQRRAPYAFDLKTVYEREGGSIKDKTVKLPEVRPAGYGVRSGRPVHVKKQPAPERLLKPPTSSQVQGDRPRLKCAPMPDSHTAERPSMMKLLSYGYEKEWHKNLQDWNDKNEKGQRKANAMAGIDKGGHSPTGNRSRRDQSKDVTSHRLHSDEEKEPFKLSKFRNVPARIDTHQKPEKAVA